MQNVNNATKKADLFRTLCRRWLTPLEAVEHCGIFSLSQRVSEWRAEGHCIVDRWVKTPGGSRVKSYRVTKPTNWTA